MAVFFAKSALLQDGWERNVVIKTDAQGWIEHVDTDAEMPQDAVALDGSVIPGMPNLHSHAFQRAMAGLAESSTGGRDSFWTWRETMYGFLRTITPADQEAIAAYLYMEMLKGGYTSVGEFHYLHHDFGGAPYAEREKTSHHIIAAAQTAGIGITHLPVLYAFGGFGGQSANEGQNRFLNDAGQITAMIESLRRHYKDNPQVRIGLALHSLRAVDRKMIEKAVASVREKDPATPIHIHIAEQIKEVNDCLAFSGKRPVEWLFENIEVDKHWCLIHATHMNEKETTALARSGAVAGLCPTTEANLGDGLFNLSDYMAQGGRLGIGSDSHISVSVIEELRLLEYGQRLLRHERAVTKTQGISSVGASLYREALSGGTRALDRETGAIAPGKRADFIVLDENNPSLLYRQGDLILDSMIFSGNQNPVRDVFCGGRHIVKNFRHLNEAEILAAYKKTLEKLLVHNTRQSPRQDIHERLRQAASIDDAEEVQKLLEEGANPYDTDDKGKTAFNHAASNGLHALHLMTKAAFEDAKKPQTQKRWKNYDINTPSGAYGSTLITYAAKVSPAALVFEMIEAGADIGIVNGSGWNLLHCAAVMPGRLDVLALLTKAFERQGKGGFINALTTHVYETDYDGHRVVFGAGLTAAQLCRARLEQDTACPTELVQYETVLAPKQKKNAACD